MPKLRPLTRSDVSVSLFISPEDIDPAGEFATDDPAADARRVRDIRRRIADGDDWAWCCVKVLARWRSFSEETTLGCRSYDSEADFMRPGGYFDDMVNEALADLNAQLASAFSELSELVIPD